MARTSTQGKSSAPRKTTSKSLTPLRDAQTDAAQARFLAAIADTGNVTRACELSAVGRTSHYRWLEQDPTYAQAFAEALDTACDHLELEARRRAIEGNRRYKFDKQGMPLCHPDEYSKAADEDGTLRPATFRPYFEREYSDTLLIFLLKGARPEKYSERVKHTGAGKGGAVLLEAIVAGSEPA